MLKIAFDVDLFLLISWLSLIVVLLAYVLWDVNYFLRIIFTVGYALYFEDNVKPDETTTVYGKENFVFN